MWQLHLALALVLTLAGMVSSVSLAPNERLLSASSPWDQPLLTRHMADGSAPRRLEARMNSGGSGSDGHRDGGSGTPGGTGDGSAGKKVGGKDGPSIPTRGPTNKRGPIKGNMYNSPYLSGHWTNRVSISPYERPPGNARSQTRGTVHAPLNVPTPPHPQPRLQIPPSVTRSTQSRLQRLPFTHSGNPPEQGGSSSTPPSPTSPSLDLRLGLGPPGKSTNRSVNLDLGLSLGQPSRSTSALPSPFQTTRPQSRKSPPSPSRLSPNKFPSHKFPSWPPPPPPPHGDTGA